DTRDRRTLARAQHVDRAAVADWWIVVDGLTLAGADNDDASSLQSSAARRLAERLRIELATRIELVGREVHGHSGLCNRNGYAIAISLDRARRLDLDLEIL